MDDLKWTKILRFILTVVNRDLFHRDFRPSSDALGQTTMSGSPVSLQPYDSWCLNVRTGPYLLPTSMHRLLLKSRIFESLEWYFKARIVFSDNIATMMNGTGSTCLMPIYCSV